MKLFMALAIALGLGLFANATQAMPVARDQAPASMVTTIAGGCGLGFHRGPYGGCRANGYYGGVYYGAPGPVVVAPVYGGPGGYYGPVGPCGGRGMHRVCNGFGRCWSVCN